MIGVNATINDGSPSTGVVNIRKADVVGEIPSDKLGFLQNKFAILSGEEMAPMESDPQGLVLGTKVRDSSQQQSDRRVNPLDLTKHTEDSILLPCSNDSQKSKMVVASTDSPIMTDRVANHGEEFDSENPHLTVTHINVDRVERLKGSNPNQFIGAPLTPGTPRWSDQSEDEPSMFHKLPDSLDIARNRGEGKLRDVLEGVSSQKSDKVRKSLQDSLVQEGPFVPQEEDAVHNQMVHSEDISSGDSLARGGANIRGGRGNRGHGGGRGSGHFSGKSWADVTASSTRSKAQILSMQNQWNGYRGEAGGQSGRSLKSRELLFTMRRRSSVTTTTTATKECEAEVFIGGGGGAKSRKSTPDFRVEGSFRRRNCKIIKCSSSGGDGVVVAKIERKRVKNSTMLLSDDVFSLVVKPGFETQLVMAFVIILDRICPNKPFTPLLCSY